MKILCLPRLLPGLPYSLSDGRDELPFGLYIMGVWRSGLQGIQRQIKFQDVYTRFAKDAQKSTVCVLCDERF